MLEEQPGPVRRLVVRCCAVRRGLGLTTVGPENDVVRRRITATLEKIEENVSSFEVDVTLVTCTRAHVNLELEMTGTN